VLLYARTASHGCRRGTCTRAPAGEVRRALKAGVLSNVQVSRCLATQNLPAAASTTVKLA
jgi:hypothetical protein